MTGRILRAAVLTLVLVSLPLPSAQACDWWNRWWGAPATTTYYAPYVANYAPAQVVNYVPQTAYRTVYVNTPVVSYAPAPGCNACGQPTTVMRPVTSFVAQPRLVPYTTYRPVVTAVAPACNACAAAVPVAPAIPVAAVAPACNTCAAAAPVAAVGAPAPYAVGYGAPGVAAPPVGAAPVQAGMPVQGGYAPGGYGPGGYTPNGYAAPGAPGSVVQSLAPTPAVPPAGDRPLGPMLNPQGPAPVQNPPLDVPPAGGAPSLPSNSGGSNRTFGDQPGTQPGGPSAAPNQNTDPNQPSEKPSEPQSRILLPPYSTPSSTPSNSSVPPRNYDPELQDRTTALPIRPITTVKNVSATNSSNANTRPSDSGWYASSR